MPIDGKLSEAIATGQARAWALPPLFTLAIANAKPRHMTALRYRYVVGGLVDVYFLLREEVDGIPTSEVYEAGVTASLGDPIPGQPE